MRDCDILTTPSEVELESDSSWDVVSVHGPDESRAVSLVGTNDRSLAKKQTF